MLALLDVDELLLALPLMERRTSYTLETHKKKDPILTSGAT